MWPKNREQSSYAGYSERERERESQKILSLSLSTQLLLQIHAESLSLSFSVRNSHSPFSSVHGFQDLDLIPTLITLITKVRFFASLSTFLSLSLTFYLHLFSSRLCPFQITIIWKARNTFSCVEQNRNENKLLFFSPKRNNEWEREEEFFWVKHFRSSCNK